MSTALVVVLVAAMGAIVGRALRPVLARFAVELSAVPVVEVVTALAFGLAAWRYADTWRLLPVLALFTMFVALSIVDLVHYRLPNDILFPGGAVTLALAVVGQLLDDGAGRIANMALGAAIYFGILLILHLVNPAGMGFGDVKLAVVMGAMLGWVAASRIETVQAIMMALLVGSALGVVLGLARMLTVRLGASFLTDPVENDNSAWHKTTFPFGPPLMIGVAVVVLWPASFLG